MTTTLEGKGGSACGAAKEHGAGSKIPNRRLHSPVEASSLVYSAKKGDAATREKSSAHQGKEGTQLGGSPF